MVGEPYHALVIREKTRHLSLTRKTVNRRPEAVTPTPNLFLGGDWTNTGLPATIEGAFGAERRQRRLLGYC